MPRHAELNLFDAGAVHDAMRGADAVLHLATRVRELDRLDDPAAWFENDRLRAESSRILVDAGLAAGVRVYGLLDGPGTGHDAPVEEFGASLHVDDAACALLAALELPAGIYNVCRDGEWVSNRRFTEAAGWHPSSHKSHSGLGSL